MIEWPRPNACSDACTTTVHRAICLADYVFLIRHRGRLLPIFYSHTTDTATAQQRLNDRMARLGHVQ